MHFLYLESVPLVHDRQRPVTIRARLLHEEYDQSSSVRRATEGHEDPNNVRTAVLRIKQCSAQGVYNIVAG